jgi:hypothetical protein
LSWAWIADVRGGGPLALLATAFAEAHLGEGAPPGPDALLALGRAIDRFAAVDTRASVESEFVERAGAFLGVVLIAHLGGAHATRDGVHRVRLGEAGFFDPFAAIERALETDPARAALVDAVALAESEARGTGPISRVAIAFGRALAELRGDLSISARFDRSVFLDEVEVDLSRVIGATDGESDGAVSAAVRKLVDMLPGGASADIGVEEACARLFPRLLGPGFDLPVVASPVAQDLRVAWVLAFEGRARFVTQKDLARWSMSAADVAAHAIRNLASRSDKARLARVETAHGPWVVARSGDGHDSARMLLPALSETLAPALGSPCIVAVPHRDALLACRDAPELAVALRARAAEDHARAPHGITPRLYRLHPDGRIESL